MTTFEVESCVPLVKLSDQINNREWAKEEVKKYRRRHLQTEQEAPPVGSLRRVYWSAKTEDRRSVVERVKSYFAGILERLVQ